MRATTTFTLLYSLMTACHALINVPKSARSTRVGTALLESKQAEYGKSLELPDTYVRCGACHSHFAIAEEDLGTRGKGRRLECSVCGNTWFQSKERIMTLRSGMELKELPQSHLDRVALNKAENKAPNFVGDAKLYVGNIAFQCSEESLFEEFSNFGNVGEVNMVYDNESGRPRGFAFVTMRTPEDAEKALANLDGKDLFGRPLQVREATN
mmetsp:Transcript_2673/g.3965  ORF Transcript_2673/g.3965 Transcript_2673/m.3965 type:complete len:211 (-) Transcript_2673:293-925(-)|eukprot:CAMPEP_0194202716 /NCGR_PEP_ID=MMETSP0156-20130528/2672_1 /TAXON_ID=33649 /ORGANISM="Thalassionema nitzschioides, Strain L26-B" /LENGTH=210 /DNA_ID=CAMNT_0038928291 /DNA_START=98 /DNA_END=730 /DNA_ORIENTATION=-